MIKRIFSKFGIYRTYSTKIGNTRFRVPIFNKLGFANLNIAEPWMQTVFNKLGNNDASLLDVGVNVGQTLLRWKSEYPNSKYIGVEPNTGCVSYVHKLIVENNITDSVVIPVALGVKEELNYLYVSKTDPSDSTASTIKNFRVNEDRRAMPIVTMPFSLLEENNFDIIKIDVEGSELEVIKSIFSYKECKSIFICEILPVYTEDNSERLKRQREIEKILQENDYLIFRLIKKNDVTLELVSEFGIHSELEYCDYLFIPKNKVDVTVSKFN